MSDICSVYIIAHAEDGRPLAGPVKVGIAGSPWARLYELQAGNPRRLFVAAEYSLSSRVEALRVERAVHEILRAARLQGEWFSSSPKEAKAAVESLLEEIEATA